MAFVQSIDNAQTARIGAEGVPADAFAAALKRSEGALDWLRARQRRRWAVRRGWRR